MRTTSMNVIIFAEDAGAANYVAELPEALRQRGISSILLATGLAKNILYQRKVTFTPTPSSTASNILTTYSPQVLITGTAFNPDSLGLLLIEAAREKSIISVGVIDAAMKVNLRFKGRGRTALTYAPDYIFVPDLTVKKSFRSLGIKNSRIKIVGHPHYDYVRKLRLQYEQKGKLTIRQQNFPRLKTNQKLVVFATEGSARVVKSKPSPNQYSLLGWNNHSGRTEVVLEEFLTAITSIKPRPYLILRLHPQDKHSDYKKYRSYFDAFSQNELPFPLLYSADLVVGLTSMLITEAALLRTPTLSILPRKGEDAWLPTIAWGLTESAYSPRQIRQLLTKLLTGSHPSIFPKIIPNNCLTTVVNLIELLLRHEKPQAI